mgnify:CR=1 FL=1
MIKLKPLKSNFKKNCKKKFDKYLKISKRIKYSRNIFFKYLAKYKIHDACIMHEKIFLALFLARYFAFFFALKTFFALFFTLFLFFILHVFAFFCTFFLHFFALYVALFLHSKLIIVSWICWTVIWINIVPRRPFFWTTRKTKRSTTLGRVQNSFTYTTVSRCAKF